VTLHEPDAWDQLWSEFDQLRARISRSTAVNINASELRSRAQLVVQTYFRQGRPGLMRLGIGEPDLAAIDQGMQELLRLSNGKNAKKTYLRVLRGIAGQRSPLGGLRERLLGGNVPPAPDRFERAEGQILDTLRAMLPETALSYEQGIRDLQSGDRISWRGTAAEFREVLREVLDHLAPDEEVAKQPGFRLEKDQTGPTMKQKAAFVLRSRGVSETARKAPQDAVSVVQEMTASFVRSTYQRGSVSTHGSPTREDVDRVKRFVDVALADLLEARGVE